MPHPLKKNTGRMKEYMGAYKTRPMHCCVVMNHTAVYLLECLRTGRTYIGQTNDFRRRLRQHRGEISGGARATRGMDVRPVVLVRGDLTITQRLRLEKKWKRVRVGAGSPAARRARALGRVLSQDRWFKTQAAGDVGKIRDRVHIEWVHVPDGCEGDACGEGWPDAIVHVVKR